MSGTDKDWGLERGMKGLFGCVGAMDAPPSYTHTS